MGIYDFEVLKDGTVIAAKQAIALPDARAAWPKVAELAKTFNEPGHKIRVRDEAGGIVILIGVVTLRHSANAVLNWRPPAFARGRVWRHFGSAMSNGPEKKLVEALKNVDAHGDVAPPHVHDPMTMVLRENAIRTNLMRWDNDRDRYVLTGAGRRRISARGHAPSTILSFRKRELLCGGVPTAKPGQQRF